MLRRRVGYRCRDHRGLPGALDHGEVVWGLRIDPAAAVVRLAGLSCLGLTRRRSCGHVSISSRKSLGPSRRARSKRPRDGPAEPLTERLQAHPATYRETELIQVHLVARNLPGPALGLHKAFGRPCPTMREALFVTDAAKQVLVLRPYLPDLGL